MPINLEQTKEDLCRAISSRKVIQFRYKDKLRIAEPYWYGMSSVNKLALLAYQTGGHSSSGKFGWKFFEALNIVGLEITEKEFTIQGPDRLRYSPIDKRFRKTFCAIPK